MSRYFIAWAGGKGLLDLWWCCAFMPGKWRTQATLRRRSKWSVSFCTIHQVNRVGSFISRCWSICIYVADYLPTSLEYCILQVTSLQERYKHFIFHSKHVSLRNINGNFHNTKQLILITNKAKKLATRPIKALLELCLVISFCGAWLVFPDLANPLHT